MAKKAYIGVNNVARRVRKIYVGVGGVAKKVKKGYIGVNGIARLFYVFGTGIHYLCKATDLSNSRMNLVGAGNPAYALFAGGFTFYPSSQSFSTVDAYDKYCVRSSAPSLNTAESYGCGAQAGNYAVFQKAYQTLAYSTSLTKTTVDDDVSTGYRYSQGCTFQDHAMLNAGRDIVSSAVSTGYKNFVVAIDDTLTLAAKVQLDNNAEIQGMASGASDTYYITAGGTYTREATITYSDGTTSTTTVAVFSPDVIALNSSFTKTECTQLSKHDVYEPYSVTGAGTAHHVFFKMSRQSRSPAVDVYNDSLTQSQLSNSLSGYGSPGTSFAGFAVFPGSSALATVNDSLTVALVPFSVTKFNRGAAAVSKDKLFYAGDGTADSVPDKTVHVFEAY